MVDVCDMGNVQMEPLPYCTRIHMHVCMHARMYVCMYARMYVCMYVCTYVLLCIPMCVYIRNVYVCTHIRMVAYE